MKESTLHKEGTVATLLNKLEYSIHMVTCCSSRVTIVAIWIISHNVVYERQTGMLIFATVA